MVLYVLTEREVSSKAVLPNLFYPLEPSRLHFCLRPAGQLFMEHLMTALFGHVKNGLKSGAKEKNGSRRKV